MSGVVGTVNDGAGGVLEFVLSSGFAAVDDVYNDRFLEFTSGVYAGLAYRIVDYVGATRLVVLGRGLEMGPPADRDGIRMVGAVESELMMSLDDFVLDTKLADDGAVGFVVRRSCRRGCGAGGHVAFTRQASCGHA